MDKDPPKAASDTEWTIEEMREFAEWLTRTMNRISDNDDVSVTVIAPPAKKVH